MTIPSYNQNNFAIAPLLGELDLQGVGGTVITAEADSSVVTALLPGQPVKIVDSANGVPKVVALTANTDFTFGFIKRNVKDQNYAAGEFLELAQGGSFIWLVSNAAIARGANVEVVYDANSGNGAVISSGGVNPIIGYALDKATGANQFIRVALRSPVTPTVAGSLFAQVTVTQAQLNAGQVLITGVGGKKILVTNYSALVAGNFATGTAAVIESTNGTPVVVSTIAQAGLTSGAALVPSSANTTLGAGFGAALGAGDGLQVVHTGSNFTGGTSITFNIDYQLVN